MIKYKDLSPWLKFATVGGISSLVLNILYFILGFIEGFFY